MLIRKHNQYFVVPKRRKRRKSASSPSHPHHESMKLYQHHRRSSSPGSRLVNHPGRATTGSVNVDSSTASSAANQRNSYIARPRTSTGSSLLPSYTTTHDSAIHSRGPSSSPQPRSADGTASSQLHSTLVTPADTSSQYTVRRYAYTGGEVVECPASDTKTHHDRPSSDTVHTTITRYQVLHPSDNNVSCSASSDVDDHTTSKQQNRRSGSFGSSRHRHVSKVDGYRCTSDRGSSGPPVTTRGFDKINSNDLAIEPPVGRDRLAGSRDTHETGTTNTSSAPRNNSDYRHSGLRDYGHDQQFAYPGEDRGHTHTSGEHYVDLDVEARGFGIRVPIDDPASEPDRSDRGGSINPRFRNSRWQPHSSRPLDSESSAPELWSYIESQPPSAPLGVSCRDDRSASSSVISKIVSAAVESTCNAEHDDEGWRGNLKDREPLKQPLPDKHYPGTNEKYPESEVRRHKGGKGGKEVRKQPLPNYPDTDSEDTTASSSLDNNAPETRIRIVSPPKLDKESPPTPKGILRKPTERFPEDPNPIREGVAPLKDAKKGNAIPHDARWTMIHRSLVSPRVLEKENERFEERPDYIIVLRVLTQEEIQRFTDLTKELRQAPRDRIRDSSAPHPAGLASIKTSYAHSSDVPFSDNDDGHYPVRHDREHESSRRRRTEDSRNDDPHGTDDDARYTLRSQPLHPHYPVNERGRQDRGERPGARGREMGRY